jgi:hypothetical protein
MRSVAVNICHNSLKQTQMSAANHYPRNTGYLETVRETSAQVTRLLASFWRRGDDGRIVQSAPSISRTFQTADNGRSCLKCAVN